MISLCHHEMDRHRTAPASREPFSFLFAADTQEHRFPVWRETLQCSSLAMALCGCRAQFQSRSQHYGASGGLAAVFAPVLEELGIDTVLTAHDHS